MKPAIIHRCTYRVKVTTVLSNVPTEVTVDLTPGLHLFQVLAKVLEYHVMDSGPTTYRAGAARHNVMLRRGTNEWKAQLDVMFIGLEEIPYTEPSAIACT